MAALICPLCDGASFRVRLRRGAYTARECTTCSLWVCGPPPSTAPSLDANTYHEVVAQRLSVGFAQTMEAVVARVKAHGGQGHWLDVGCGTGKLIEVAQRRGFEVSGIEAMPAARTFANDSVRSRIRIADVESASLSRDAADVVSMVQVIEHLRAPVATLKLICDGLRSGGLVYLETPNINAASHLFKRQEWIDTNIAADHWHLFNVDTLTETARRADLDVIEAWTFFKGLGLRSRRPRLGRVALRALNETMGRGRLGNCVALIARRR